MFIELYGRKIQSVCSVASILYLTDLTRQSFEDLTSFSLELGI